MRVSIVITTYKNPEYLVEAVESVLEQTFKDFELIIVNDDPIKIIHSFNDSRIVYLQNKENLGGAKSLNVGLKKAKGEYIAILDDDDSWVSDDKLERQVKFLDENKDYVAVGTNIINQKESDGKLSLLGAPIPHSSILFRKGTMYNENLPRAKDLDLILNLSKRGKLGIIKDCFIKYRRDCDVDTRLSDYYYHKKVALLHKKEFPLRQAIIAYTILSAKRIMFQIFKRFPFLFRYYKTWRGYSL